MDLIATTNRKLFETEVGTSNNSNNLVDIIFRLKCRSTLTFLITLIVDYSDLAL